jgi:sulfatase maturation enzyme AslB (radical SAM superfamily)
MKKLEEYNWICPEPFTGITTTTNGQFRPCCVVSDEFRTIPVDQMYYSHQHDFQSFYNGHFMKRLRTAMKTDTDTDFLNTYCSKCIKEETSGNRSSRQWYLSRFDNIFKSNKNELETIIHNETFPTFFHTMQLNNLSGNYCNLSCNMCSEHFSSSILNEKIKLNEPITVIANTVNGKLSPLIKQDNSEQFTQELKGILSNTLEIKFAGGEPLLSKENYELLSLCDNKDTVIRIITNGTVNPSKFINICKKFKQVHVNISIEGIGAVNNYIRYSSNWVDIVDSYKKFLQAGYKVTFVTTVNSINIGSLADILNVIPEKHVSFASLVDNNFYSLNSIPPDIKDVYLKRLKLFKPFNQKDRLINFLENCTYVETDMIEMIQHIKRRDKLRGTNLLNVFPEWKEYYDRY